MSVSSNKQTDSAERKTSVMLQLAERQAEQCVSVCYADMHYQADISSDMRIFLAAVAFMIVS